MNRVLQANVLRLYRLVPYRLFSGRSWRYDDFDDDADVTYDGGGRYTTRVHNTAVPPDFVDYTRSPGGIVRRRDRRLERKERERQLMKARRRALGSLTSRAHEGRYGAAHVRGDSGETRRQLQVARRVRDALQAELNALKESVAHASVLRGRVTIDHVTMTRDCRHGRVYWRPLIERERTAYSSLLREANAHLQATLAQRLQMKYAVAVHWVRERYVPFVNPVKLATFDASSTFSMHSQYAAAVHGDVLRDGASLRDDDIASMRDELDGAVHAREALDILQKATEKLSKTSYERYADESPAREEQAEADRDEWEAEEREAAARETP